MNSCCPIVELRQYTLVPGRREVLISLFEQEFIETQEASGMIVIGQFRDLNNPDRFVWLRGFSDMKSRARQLEEFYGGPVWKAHREAANGTMIDSDNVLLLRPAQPDSGFPLKGARRAATGSTKVADTVLAAAIYHFASDADPNIAGFFQSELEPGLSQVAASAVASFVTESHPNTFPALPVREDANVFVSFSVFPNRGAWNEHGRRFTELMCKGKKLSKLIKGEPEVLVLAPTARSLLR